MIVAKEQRPDTVSFGPFLLAVDKRLLMRDGIVIELGTRALDLLITFALHPNIVISKRDLLAHAWPDMIVEEGSLRFQIAILRKALGDGGNGSRYITTLTGRGYCFVAPVAVTEPPVIRRSTDIPQWFDANLPNRPLRVIGRSDDIAIISEQLLRCRFVTIIGTGGVGKTTVAVELAHDLANTFENEVLFIDLGTLTDPDLVATSMASMLGLTFQSDDPTPGIIAYLRDKRILLILDTCEHLIEAVAELAARIFGAAPHVHILATSREALQVEGERIYRLAPLACPPDNAQSMAAVVHEFPATQLFIERAAANGAGLDLTDSDAAIVTAICRQLDGVALAIELAARRVEAYGLQQIATHLDQSVALLWMGMRTAPARQKTLQATLSWSYGLLAEPERIVLHRLAIFVGDFTMEAALAVVTNDKIDEAMVLNAVDSLVNKSIVATRPAGAMMRYRLLDTTRAYALDLSEVDHELASRHAIYCRRWLEETEGALNVLAADRGRSNHLTALNNVRAALEWCFGKTGDLALGIDLAAAAAQIFLAMSLLTECIRWSESALSVVGEDGRRQKEEMHLQTALGVSLMFTRGAAAVAGMALKRSLAIAETRGDAFEQLRALGPLQMFHHRLGEFDTAAMYAKRGSALSANLQDMVAVTSAHSLMGISHFMTGELGIARYEIEAALQRGRNSLGTSTIYLGYDGKNLAGAILASTLWLQGYPDQAVEVANLTVCEAERLDHGLTLALALIWAVYVFVWTGDFENARKHTDRLMTLADSRSFGPYLAVGRGFRGQLAILQGDANKGVQILRGCLSEFFGMPYHVQTSPISASLAQGLGVIGNFTEGLALADAAIRNIERNGDYCYLPEVLRSKARLLSSITNPRLEDAEMCLMRAIDLARCQGARAWELRNATDLALLLVGQNRCKEARRLLLSIYEQFNEGLETADLKAAERLLITLR